MKNRFVYLVCLISNLLILTACGGGGGNGTANNDSDNTPSGNDSNPVLTVSDLSIVEANLTGNLTLSLSKASEESITIDLSTTAETASADEFSLGASSVTFTAGETSKTVTVNIVDDSIDEQDETFLVSAQANSAVTLGDGEATVTIVDDDPSALSADAINIVEGSNGTLQFYLSTATSTDASVSYTTAASGTATAGVDYPTQSGTVNFTAGDSTADLTVETSGDSLNEGNETFSILLSNANGITLDTTEITVTILDDDIAVGLSAQPDNTTCLAGDRPASVGSVSTERVFSDIEISGPIQLLQSPLDNSRWYVVQQGGSVITFLEDDSSSTQMISLTVTTTAYEGGLLGMAFDPDFASNGYVYLSYTTGNSSLTSQLDRYTSSDNGLTLDPATRKSILMLAQPYDNHNGGSIHFGNDGFLYYAMGDGGSGYDPDRRSQNTKNLYGTLIRIDVDSSAAYDIPETNPFSGNDKCDSGTDVNATEDCPEIFAWGLRNPWQFSIDRETGNIWAGDVGQDQIEEVNIVELGGNYGWVTLEGTECVFDENCDTTGLVPPIVEYPQGASYQAVTGGYVYRGSELNGFYGKYIYADYNQQLFYIGEDENNQPEHRELLTVQNHGVASFATDHLGELYYTNIYQNSIHKLVSTEPAGSDDFPTLLSETGCFNTATQTPNSALIPYDLNQALWSDDAEKTRYMALPNDSQITINSDGDWIFPTGTVLVKNFFLDDTIFETRLLKLHADGWGGYTYEWNEAGDEATLVTGGKTKTVSGQTWNYPSSRECFTCHTGVANDALGPETSQLNKEFLYPNTVTSNQLTTLSFIDVLTPALSDLPENLTAIPALNDETASLEARAKGYLHVNCSGCHRAEGPTNSTMRLDYDTPLASMGICDVTPNNPLDVEDAKLLTPGNAEKSIIINRMGRRDNFQMPPLGTHLVDTQAVTVITNWVNSLASCP